ncbi:hypothetical protein QJQ45_026966 [Haematococcus lacustris]|nr:hypothetical protein QJQ45_026966 [Haematococcus lacustris]
MQLRQLSGAPRFGLQRTSHVASASMISKLFGGGASSPTNQHKQHKQLWFNDASPSWDELTNMVKSKQAALGLDFWQDPEHAPTNPTALKRTFGQKGPIRVKLYRDHAAWCPYCQKVWLQLEEKRIPYTMEKVNMRCYGDKQRSFLAKVPNGLLPVIELDGQVVTESSVIMQLLEEVGAPGSGLVLCSTQAFPDHTPLMPPRGTPSRMRAEQLMRLERRLFGDWLGWLTRSGLKG